ncbi:hypothetical protein [Sporisorium scitamineum]|uniref:Uncharacterized protein n=1 Tax=Sporisorium scitamineum TaxID=49012 RepID=A0A0F7S3E5_9BASI|nr:hypothetical protein [Sporisorium scitamineum]
MSLRNALDGDPPQSQFRLLPRQLDFVHQVPADRVAVCIIFFCLV